MTEAEYIAVLWRVIYALAGIVAILVAVVWRHIVEDRKARADLERCKYALGINGRER